jgi:diguanylate cyclase (GGDEF)-like protein
MAELADATRLDPLTGLLNRAAFFDRLDEAVARGARQHQPVGVLFIDLDDFKRVNDTWGHQTGDVVLVELGARLSSAIRDSAATGERSPAAR